jgi:PKD repeat protein
MITNLRVNSVAGNQVVLRWDAPVGVTPSEYLVEGGIVPDVVLAAFPTGIAAPIVAFAAPTGSFWVRVRFLDGTGPSVPSLDVPLIVNMPVPPSTPADFTAAVAGTAVNLSWRNTFTGGSPANILVDVTGTATASIPLSPTGTAAFTGVPGGNYNVSLRAANGAGTSPATSPTTLTVPTACSGVPNVPANFLFFRLGTTVFLLWDPPAAGPAPLGYRLNVTGSFVGAIPVADRIVSTPVAPGSYTVSVIATNACGAGAPTAAQTVTVP